jgi:hypothetical protein
MPCDYCGKPMTDQGRCPNNPFSEFHVASDARTERLPPKSKCDYCGKPLSDPDPCRKNPWSDFHV